MINLINDFWNGKIKLWKSYWLIGELLNALVILIVFNLEIRIFNNDTLTNFLPFLNFSDFTLVSKFIMIIWTIFITVGIWRSAENYKGPFWLIALTLFYIGFNNFIILYFVIINIFK